MHVMMQIPAQISFLFQMTEFPVTACCVHMIDPSSPDLTEEVEWTVSLSSKGSFRNLGKCVSQLSDGPLFFPIMPPMPACTEIRLDISGPTRMENRVIEMRGLELSHRAWPGA
jgi:hypothetical protein